MLFPYANNQAVLTTCSHTTRDLLGFATVLLLHLFYNRYLEMLPLHLCTKLAVSLPRYFVTAFGWPTMEARVQKEQQFGVLERLWLPNWFPAQTDWFPSEPLLIVSWCPLQPARGQRNPDQEDQAETMHSEDHTLAS